MLNVGARVQRERGDNMSILAGIAAGMIALALLSVVALLVLFILIIIDLIIGGVRHDSLGKAAPLQLSAL